MQFGCNNMLMQTNLQTFASVQKFLQTFGTFILFYFTYVREALYVPDSLSLTQFSILAAVL